MQFCKAGVYSLATVARNILLMLAVALVAGCSISKPPLDTAAGLSCVDDSPHCVKQRIATLNSFNADKSRLWVMQAVSPRAYASGFRLFAYRAQLSKLSCRELKHGQAEAARGPKVLRSSRSGLTSAQISRGAMLCKDVGRDLKREIRRRC